MGLTILKHWPVLGAALVISCGSSFHFGFQMTAMNPSEEVLKTFINDSYYHHYHSIPGDSVFTYLWPVIVNLQSVGGLVGTVSGFFMIEKLGRKKSFYVTTPLVVFSCFLMVLSKYVNAFEVYAAGRFLCGVAQGIIVGLQPLYLNEISPTAIQGMIGSVTGQIVEIGYTLGAVCGLPVVLGRDDLWQFIFLLQGAPTLLTAFALPFLPESPKFLASRHDVDGAKRSLLWFGRTESEADQEIQELQKELAASSKDQLGFKDILKIRYIRKSILLCWTLVLTSGYSGIMALSYFSARILQNGGLSATNAAYGTVGIASLSFFGAACGGFLVERCGRRPIILGTYLSLLICNVLLIVFSYLNHAYGFLWTAYANIGVAATLIFSFGLGPTIILFFITSEMVPQSAKSIAQMTSMIMQWLGILSAGLIFYPLQIAIGELCFLVHVVPLLFGLVVFWFWLPETKNKNPLAIMKELGYKGDEDAWEANQMQSTGRSGTDMETEKHKY